MTTDHAFKSIYCKICRHSTFIVINLEKESSIINWCLNIPLFLHYACVCFLKEQTSVNMIITMCVQCVELVVLINKTSIIHKIINKILKIKITSSNTKMDFLFAFHPPRRGVGRPLYNNYNKDVTTNQPHYLAKYIFPYNLT